jgi:hypothetical protein
MDILSVSQCLRFDGHLSYFVDIAPFPADLDCRKSFRKVKRQIKIRFNDDLSRAIDITACIRICAIRNTFIPSVGGEAPTIRRRSPGHPSKLLLLRARRKRIDTVVLVAVCMGQFSDPTRAIDKPFITANSAIR